MRTARRRIGSAFPSERRSGVIILEMIVAAPLFFIMMLAIFEFGFLLLTLQVAHTALIEGTRRAAELYPPAYPFDVAGADNDVADQVVEFMNEHLMVQCLEIYDTTQGFVDDPADANVQVIIERGASIVSRGDAVSLPMGHVCTPHGPAPASNEVRVTLCFRLVDPVNPDGCGDPVPDWLAPFGFSLLDCVFEASSRMDIE
jgi:hypothetical protein